MVWDMLEEKRAAKCPAAASKCILIMELQVLCSGYFSQGKVLPCSTPLVRAENIPSTGCRVLKGSCHIPRCSPAASSHFRGTRMRQAQPWGIHAKQHLPN